MIYGNLFLADWRTARPEGEEPESSFESPRLRLFFFGTLYNGDVLRAAPGDSNAKIAADAFLSGSDAGFARLDGSFTIVYYTDTECGVARDFHGTHHSVYFTSEGRFATSWQLLQENASGAKSGYNPVVLSQFLQRGFRRGDDSVMTDIRSLPAGYRLCTEAETCCMRPLRDLSCPIAPAMSAAGLPQDVESCSRRYGELHAQAIRRRIGDSRKVGILLSGGYDSGSNLAALRGVYDGPVDSYSVGFKGDAWTELPVARLMSRTFGTRHHEYEMDGTEIEALPEIVRFLGEPFVEGGLMVNYCAMRMLGDDKPEVILGGDGSDQYFGTSGREVALHYLAARAGLRPLLRGVDSLLSRERFDTGGKLSRVRFHLDKILHVLEGDSFGFSDSALRALLQNPQDFVPALSPRADTRSFAHLYTQHALESDMSVVINRVILFKASRMARMFGNNLVFPFMDLELFRFLQELPVGLKCKGGSVLDIARGRCVSKYLLKHCYKPLLPEAVTSKKKQGGFAPMPLFFSDDARRARLREFVLSSGILDSYLRRDAVGKFLADYDRDVRRTGSWFWYRQNKALQYFNLLSLAVWWEEFVEGKEVKL